LRASRADLIVPDAYNNFAAAERILIARIAPD